MRWWLLACFIACGGDPSTVDTTVDATSPSDVLIDTVALDVATPEVAPGCATDCTELDTPCRRGRCRFGNCVVELITFVACDDHDPCTLDEHCRNGGCGDGRPLCDDDDPRTLDLCSAGACTSHEPIAPDDPTHCGAAQNECRGGTCSDGHCTTCARSWEESDAITGLECPDMPAGRRIVATARGTITVRQPTVLFLELAGSDWSPCALLDECPAVGACGIPAGCAVALAPGTGQFELSIETLSFAPSAFGARLSYSREADVTLRKSFGPTMLTIEAK